MTRADHVLQLLKQGSYSKHDLARLTGLKMRDKALSVAVIEGMPFMFGFGNDIEDAKEQAISAAKNALTPVAI